MYEKKVVDEVLSLEEEEESEIEMLFREMEFCLVVVYYFEEEVFFRCFVFFYKVISFMRLVLL